MSQTKSVVRKQLNADCLFHLIHTEFAKIPDVCDREVESSVADALKSGCALFSLKDPSLLAFDQRRHDETTLKNLKTVYHIGSVPCDTQMRVILDQVETEEFAPAFGEIFRQAQRGKVLEKLVFLDNRYLLSLDGTQYFSSKKVHCPSCLEKTTSKTGAITSSQQMLGAAIVHPDVHEVLPVCPEPIEKQDGQRKNECARHAAKRFVDQFRKAHPHLTVIVIEDGLSSNAPPLREFVSPDRRFLLGGKPGDHAFLFQQVDAAVSSGNTTEFTIQKEDVTPRFRVLNEVALHESNQDVMVNFLEYGEIQADGTTPHFSWVTDIPITCENAFHLMRGGRARWKVENETFNTLKNHGYHCEHNFGHGQHNLSVVFALLMMLAFLVDQLLQRACQLVQAVWRKEGSKARMGEQMRALFYRLECASMVDLFNALRYGYRGERLVMLEDSS